MTIPHSIKQSISYQCQQYPQQSCIYTEHQQISYDSLEKTINQLNQNLNQHLSILPIQQNSSITIAVLLPQTIDNLITCLTLLCHHTCLPLNPNLKANEHIELLKLAQSSVLITQQGFATETAKLASQQGITILTLQVAEVSHNNNNNNQTDRLTLELWQSNQNQTNNNTDNKPYSEPNPNGSKYHDDSTETVRLILPTSGTTGQPKLVGLTDNQLLTATQVIIDTLQLTQKDCGLHAMPMYHIGTFVDMLLVPLLSGGSLFVRQIQQTQQIVNTLCTDKITWYQCVPTMLSDLIRHANPQLNAQLRFIRSVSSPLSQQLQDEFVSHYHIPIIPMYGMTEAAGQITSWGLDTSWQKQDSVGKVCTTQVCIIDEQHNRLPSPQKGQICITGTQVITDYFYNPSSQDTHITIDGQKWLMTGDQGYIDSDGFLFITGRIKELINRGGEKISAQFIDFALNQHPIVAELASFAIPHPTLGEEVAVAVVPTTDKNLLNEAAVIDSILTYAKSQLSTFQLPKLIVLVDKLPKTNSGKVQRHQLSKQFANQHLTNFTTTPKTTITTKNEPLDDKEYAQLLIQIKALWQNILEVEQINDDDDFFLLGGDSLSAATFIDQLQQHYPTLSNDWLINLYDSPTAATFTVALQQALNKTQNKNSNQPSANLSQPINTTDALPPLDDFVKDGLRAYLTAWSGKRVDSEGLVVVHNPDGSLPPLFWCVQAHHELTNLVAELPSDLPVYGMRSLYCIQEPKERDNDALAAYYANVILSLNTQQPYYLGGFCEGATIMLKVAQYLQQQGKTVALLLMIDKFTDEPYQGKIATFWTTKDFQNQQIRQYIQQQRPPIAQLRQKQGMVYECEQFFYPELKWLEKNLSVHSIYYYDCCHGDELNIDYMQPLAQDIWHEIQQTADDMNGLSNDLNKQMTQAVHPVQLTTHAPHTQPYQIKAKLPKIMYKRNKQQQIHITLCNTSEQDWLATEQSGLTVSARWLNHRGEFRQLAGQAFLTQPLAINQSVDLTFAVVIPEKSMPKFYQLQIDLVQEGHHWFSDLAYGYCAYQQHIMIV
ncbi:non-ribosomal peptide synthetase [Psychrobacter sp. I-STPA10]|uniref:non-ribosomal peptide synthetase n=1 Tax=Psychrobacter sp. I-STPA10 TaxID=2585769 RepID=UPI001E65BC24|nr:AMP-binding protein [Psychrobacter sp. I-STPA10]